LDKFFQKLLSGLVKLTYWEFQRGKIGNGGVIGEKLRLGKLGL